MLQRLPKQVKRSLQISNKSHTSLRHLLNARTVTIRNKSSMLSACSNNFTLNACTTRSNKSNSMLSARTTRNKSSSSSSSSSNSSHIMLNARTTRSNVLNARTVSIRNKSSNKKKIMLNNNISMYCPHRRSFATLSPREDLLRMKEDEEGSGENVEEGGSGGENFEEGGGSGGELSESDYEQYGMLLWGPLRQDSYEFMFPGSDDNLIIEGVIDNGPVIVLQDIFDVELDKVFGEMDKYDISDEERKQRAHEESIAKQKLVYDWTTKKRYTREQMYQLVKSGEADKLVQYMQRFEYRSINMFTENTELSERQLGRVELFAILIEYVDFMRVYGLWKDKYLQSASTRLAQLMDKFSRDLPELDKLRAKLVNFKGEIVTSAITPQNAEQYMYTLFTEYDVAMSYLQDIWKANHRSAIVIHFQHIRFRMHWELPYLIYQQFIYRNQFDEAIALMDKLLDSTWKISDGDGGISGGSGNSGNSGSGNNDSGSIAEENQEGEQTQSKPQSHSQPQRTFYLMFKAYALALKGEFQQAMEICTLAEAAMEEAEELIEATNEIGEDMVSLCDMAFTVTNFLCNRDTIIDMNVGATTAATVIDWISEEQYQEFVVEPMERFWSMPMFVSVVAECIKYYDPIESVKWSNFGLRLTQNYNALGPDFTHFLVMKAEAIQKIQHISQDLIEPLYMQAREVNKLMLGDSNPQLVEINLSYANYLESVNGNSAEIERLRKEADEIQTAFGYKLTKRQNIFTSLLHKTKREVFDAEQLKNFRTSSTGENIDDNESDDYQKE